MAYIRKIRNINEIDDLFIGAKKIEFCFEGRFRGYYPEMRSKRKDNGFFETHVKWAEKEEGKIYFMEDKFITVDKEKTIDKIKKYIRYITLQQNEEECWKRIRELLSERSVNTNKFSMA